MLEISSSPPPHPRDAPQHEEFLQREERSSPGSFAYRWTHLETARQTEFNRVVYRFACTPGAVGAAGSTASPADPVFWVVHGVFEKMLAALRTAPAFAAYNMTWTSSGCAGSAWDDALLFKDLFDGAPAQDGYYTNAELWALLTPGNPNLGYVYDQLTQWGELAWDPWADG